MRSKSLKPILFSAILWLILYSAESAAAQAAEDDSLRIMRLLSEADQQLLKNQQESVRLTRQAYSESTRKGAYLKGLTSLMLGRAYQQQRDYHLARKYYLESLDWREKWDDPALLAVIYMLLSENHSHLHQFPEALAYGHKALAISKSLSDREQKLTAFQHMGSTHSWAYHDSAERDTYSPAFSLDSALYYFELAKQMGPFTPSQKASLSTSLGITYFHLADKRAIDHFREALAIRKELKEVSREIDVLQFLGQAYVSQKYYSAARLALDEAHKRYKEGQFEDEFLMTKISWGYVRLFKATGNYKKAFHWIVQANKGRDRRLLADREGAISSLTVQYETEKKELLLQKQRDEIEKQTQNLYHEQNIKRISIFGGILMLIAAGIFYLLYQRNRRLSRFNAILLQEQNHRLNNNLQRLSSVMDFQLISLVDGQAKKLLKENLARIQTIALLHRHLCLRNDSAVPVSDYLRQIVQHLLEVGSLPGLNVSYSIEDLVLESRQLLPLGLIVNEVVTNALKYAYTNVASPSLCVTFSQSPSGYLLVVSDNGPGAQQTSDSNSIGLRLVELFVRELKGTFQLSYENGTVFRLEFSKK